MAQRQTNQRQTANNDRLMYELTARCEVAQDWWQVGNYRGKRMLQSLSDNRPIVVCRLIKTTEIVDSAK